MNHRQTAKIFLSSKMDKAGEKYHSYRQAIINWIESEYPFLEIYPFEKTAHAGHTRSWEIKEIRDCALFIAIIFEDSKEVDYEIKCALDLKNPVLLFFFPSPGWPLENPPLVAGSKSPTRVSAERSFI